MSWIKAIAIALVVLGLLLAAMVVRGQWRWGAGTRALVARLEAARTPPPVDRYEAARELPGLPPPVQRYFRTVLREGQPIVTGVTVEHRGTFNLGEAADAWKPFTSWQRVITRRPGFVWDARVSMAPGLAVHVHDAFVAGEGILHPAILGLFSLTTLRASSPEPGGVAHGELMRFFAEAAWYPTALLPSQGVRWEAVDERSARATITDGAITLTLGFGFADDGTMAWTRADARGRTVGGTVVMTPWEGRWSDVAERDGMKVPMSGEVAWLTPQGRKPYWRGAVTALQFEFAATR